ncbi:hypothetical protein GLOIN_2v1837337 [Rhizophagus irregularis DAOM 181602=DAOM 197198]|uniref:MIR domain-containing protein n=1 Tax=Rhizophagus irregularis (strain DAOM 181602 / DAOM 197198 / MUCL 43194) TaxID=747089 RepID=A0A2P4QJR6_RHIID|nr:hypothetical protein GLOIN_2v1837337 [Rhizophagus irregularis DAOM 181602=DAOM 197198]POG77863.1 hypothetical protein GLOIN_2v1837337 [Rhizophagus irregularis DAOM 181602=DAOM 197198]|eukprot:XP_025184729.1 hypothetical protein GLOIN_2v1837337 [Rhizophagus irregularis DAOM 181602=DAOM 197198]
MDVPKYDGNIHPDEWIKDLQKYDYFWRKKYNLTCLDMAISLVDSTIKLPTGIDTYEKLSKALKEDISFTVFKNTNKKMLQLLKYVPESRSELIVNESVVALKHVATGKYLSSIENLCYKTGSKTQLVFVESPEPGPNSLWKINFNDKELATYAGTSIGLQHIKSNKFLGICYEGYQGNFIYGLYGYYKSPLTKQTWVWEKHTEVSCGGDENKWNFKHSKLESHQGFLKSNDIINLSIKKKYDSNGDSTSDRQVEFLRSHDIQFTIRGDTFQEVCCHNEILGVNDEWCIKLIKQYNLTLDQIC